MCGHKVNYFRRYLFGRTNEVALVLAILIVNNNDHPAIPDVIRRFLDRAQRHLVFRSPISKIETEFYRMLSVIAN